MAKNQEQVDEIAEKEEEKKAKAEEEAKKAEEEAKAKAEEEAKKAEEEAKVKAEEEAKKAENEEKAKKEAKTNSVKLKVLIAFTDKYTKQDYVIDDEILVDEDRAKELLTDSRRLVIKQN